MKLGQLFQSQQMRRLASHNLIIVLERIHTNCNEYQAKRLEMIYLSHKIAASIRTEILLHSRTMFRNYYRLRSDLTSSLKLDPLNWNNTTTISPHLSMNNSMIK